MSPEHGWVRRVARARRLGGLEAREFWRLTPAEVHAICKDGVEERLAFDKRADWRNASLMCLLANRLRFGAGNERTYQIDDFMPGDRPALTGEQVRAKMFELFG